MNQPPERMEELPEELDVIVVGGGPAGSVSARQPAAAGHRVLVLERARFPREQICVEYLCPAAVSLLEELGLLRALDGIAQRVITRVRIASPSGHVVEGGFVRRDASASHGISIARSALVQAPLREAPAAGPSAISRARAPASAKKGCRR